MEQKPSIRTVVTAAERARMLGTLDCLNLCDCTPNPSSPAVVNLLLRAFSSFEKEEHVKRGVCMRPIDPTNI